MQKHLHNFKDRELLSMPLVEYFNLGASKIEVKQNRILLLAAILVHLSIPPLAWVSVDESQHLSNYHVE